jgi:hypothetical protein
MTNTEINAAIAEECGWRFTPIPERPFTDDEKFAATGCWTAPGDESWRHSPLPNYAGCLNAMHEAEGHLDYVQCATYFDTINDMMMDVPGNEEYDAQSWVFNTPAPVKAKAFLIAKGKWRDA